MTADDNAYLQQGASGSTSGVGPSNSVIRKTSLGYDVDTHRITWQVIVNADRNTLPDASITDTIGVGQKYLPGTFTINAGAPVNSLTGSRSFSGSLPADPATTSTVLRYNFGAISSAYTITYKTEVIDPTVWAGNTSETLNDSVVLDPGNGVTSTSSANQALFPDIIQKAASYDYATHEITWMIDVDESQIPSTGVVVTENLTGGGLDDFALESSTIMEEGVPLVSDPADYPAVGAYHYDASTRKLTINLGNLANPNSADRTRTITFKMKLAKTGADYDAYFSQNGDKVITNTANVTSDQNPHITSSSESQTIHNTLVGKEGYYSSGHAYIDWAVEVNQNRIALGRHHFDRYPAAGTGIGHLLHRVIRSDAEPGWQPFACAFLRRWHRHTIGGRDAHRLDSGECLLRCSYAEADLYHARWCGQRTALPLVFRTTVDASYASGASFSNAIDLKSSTYLESTTTSSQLVGFSSESGSAWGTTGDVTVMKRETRPAQRLQEPSSACTTSMVTWSVSPR